LREIIKAYFDILYRENDPGTEGGTDPSNPWLNTKYILERQ
jgi:hypothetical protein